MSNNALFFQRAITQGRPPAGCGADTGPDGMVRMQRWWEARRLLSHLFSSLTAFIKQMCPLQRQTRERTDKHGIMRSFAFVFTWQSMMQIWLLSGAFPTGWDRRVYMWGVVESGYCVWWKITPYSVMHSPLAKRKKKENIYINFKEEINA